MESKIEIFANEEFGEIRTVIVNEEPYFVGKDVAEILGYSNPSKALADHVDEDDKLNNESLSSLGQRGGWLINESGLYSLIFSSKMPNAKKFKHWVTAEVLPQIRKTGGYIPIGEDETNDEFLAKAFIIATQTLRKKDKIIASKNKQLEAQEPLVNFANKVSNSSNLIDMDKMAKLLKDEKINIGRNRLFQWLRKKEILMKNNVPYQKYIERGYFKLKELAYETPYGTKTNVITLITGKGQIYITEKLRKEYLAKKDTQKCPLLM